MKNFIDTFSKTLAILVALFFFGTSLLFVSGVDIDQLFKGIGPEEKRRSISLDSVITQIAEVAYVQDSFTSEYSYDEDGFLWFTGKSCLIIYEGYVKAGVDDANSITTTIIDDDKTIVVTFPEPVILGDVYIDPASIEALNAEEGWFDKFDMDDMNDFVVEFQEIELEKALDEGILEEAKESIIGQTVSMISEALKGTDYEDYDIQVVFEDEPSSAGDFKMDKYKDAVAEKD